MKDERLIVALDVRTMAEVRALAEQLGETVSYYKVGMELFYAVGRTVIDYLHDEGKRIFLDLKLHDIPNTVTEGLCSLTGLRADMMNVHASGGYTMMRTAAERVREKAEREGIPAPKLIAVTVLTSIGKSEWTQMGNRDAVRERVVRLAELAKKAELDGVVASPMEAAAIREACGKDFLIVTPGVRPAGAAADDQSRIATPSAALENGATHIVVGRPIRAASDPRAAAEAIIREMEGVR